MENLFLNIPFTKYIIISLIVMAVVCTHAISQYYMILSCYMVFMHGEVWRPFTGLLYTGTLGMNLIFTLIHAYFCISQLERNLTDKKGEFTYLLIITAIPSIVCTYTVRELAHKSRA